LVIAPYSCYVTSYVSKIAFSFASIFIHSHERYYADKFLIAMKTSAYNKSGRGGEYTYHSLVSQLSVEQHEHTSATEDDFLLEEISEHCQGKMILMASSSSPDNNSTDKKNFPKIAKMKWFHMIQETILCFGLFLLGWYGPKYCKPSEESVQSMPIPYQVMKSSGDVVLDFDLNHPLVDPPAIPSGLLLHSCVTLPLIIICMATMLIRPTTTTTTNGTPFRSTTHYYELQSGICAFFVAIGSSEGFTQLIKYFVLRKRPNFYQLCGFNTSTLQCEAPLSRVQEAMFSFPSGHTSLSFCGMTFLVWFLLGRLARQLSTSTISSPLKRKVMVYSCIALPWGYSTYVGATRIVDTWHHVDDVLAGCLLGTTCATIAYHLYHPHVLSRFAGLPWNCMTTAIQQRQYQNNNKNNFVTSTSSGSMNNGGANDSGGVSIPMGSVPEKLPSFHE